MEGLEARVQTLLIWSVRFCLLCFIVGLALRFGGYPANWPFDVGILVLMLGPLGRVILSLLAFYQDRDWPFFLATVGVVLVLSMTFIAAWSIRTQVA
ncbi:MAG: DUF1634 domain-containing protein [Deltaproteobacteria bacterium]|nr:DUF1634 domain-containing protein [Deltaproteobacteria bacterium]